MVEEIREDQKFERASLREMLTTPRYRTQLFAGVLLLSTTVVNGFMGTVMYSRDILAGVGYGGDQAEFSTIGERYLPLCERYLSTAKLFTI